MPGPADATLIEDAGQLPQPMPAAAGLTVFAFGPGTGECIVVRCSDGESEQWMVVDSATYGIAQDHPALMLLDHYGAEIQHLVITHRHADHVGGADRLIERMRDDDSPDRSVMLADRFIAKQAAGIVERDAESTIISGALTPALAALHEAMTGDELAWTPINAHTGVAARNLADATVLIRAPQQPVTAPIPPARANGQSIVLEISWRGTTLVLCGDATTAVFASMPRPAAHDVLKVPHHGSQGSQHAAWTDGDVSRAWFCTPYSSSSLPVVEGADLGDEQDRDELPTPDLLDHVHHVLLTALPVSQSFALTEPAMLNRSEYQAEIDARASGRELAGTRPALSWFDPMWYVAVGVEGGPQFGRGVATVLLCSMSAAESA